MVNERSDPVITNCTFVRNSADSQGGGVMAGFQVAVITPTTLLSRQHFNTFCERYRGLPVVIEELSRLIPPTGTACIQALAALFLIAVPFLDRGRLSSVAVRAALAAGAGSVLALSILGVKA